MKKEWSRSWNSSVQPRKQRKYRHNAPLHVRNDFVRATLSPDLRSRYSKRSMRIRKGDEIKVMRGTFKGKTGTVETVDLNKSRIFTEDIKIKKVDGSEISKGLEPSNLMITKLKLDDKRRQAILSRREDALKAKKEKPAPKPPKQEPAKPSTEAESKKPAKTKTVKPKPAKKATKATRKPPAKKPATKKPAKKPAAKPKKKS